MSKKLRWQEEVEEIIEGMGEIDPRWTPLAEIREKLPPGPPGDIAPRCPTGSEAVSAQPDCDLRAALRQLEQRALRTRREAEAKKAEADRLRQRLGELARERDQLLAAVRRVRASIAWAGEEAQPVLEKAEARVSSIEDEMRGLRARIQELEGEPGLQLLRAEETQRAAQAEAQRQADEARTLLKEGRVAEAIRHLRRALRKAGEPAPAPLLRAWEETRTQARKAVDAIYFRAREALAGGDPAKAITEAASVADLLPAVRVEVRRPLHGVFCRAAAALAPGDMPLVLVRGRRGERGWTAPPGTLAIGTPIQGGVRVLHNLGTPWKEGAVVREMEAEVLPLRTRHGGQGQQDTAR